MAIAYVSSADGSFVLSASSLSWNHDATGTDALVVVVRADASDFISGVTYNGVAMTLIDKDVQQRYVYTFLLISPASGSHAVVVSASATCDFITGVSSGYSGNGLSGQPDAHQINKVNGDDHITAALTTVADNCWVIAGVGNNFGAATGGTGLTFRQTTAVGVGVGDSNGVITPAGSFSQTAQGGTPAVTQWVMGQLSLSPAGGAASIIINPLTGPLAPVGYIQ